jgi:anti-sigma regulatory factor (Ser/Thr protein kinase)
VSHNWLLAASGPQGTLTEARPFAVADFADRCPADEHAVSCELGPRPESVKTGRDFTRITLQQWRMGDVADAAELVVSELVTNALRHGLLSARRMPGEHPIGLRLLRQAQYLMCLVSDPGSDIPVRRDSAEYAEGGRGLVVVESCSLRWGWQPLDEDGKVVWALLRARELPAPAARGRGLGRQAADTCDFRRNALAGPCLRPDAPARRRLLGDACARRCRRAAV